jgi:hypothetical protein
VAIELGAILASVLMLVYAHNAASGAEMDVGLGYMVLNAVGVCSTRPTGCRP